MDDLARVLAQGDDRPIAGHPEALRDLKLILDARTPHYERADVTLDTTGNRVELSLVELRMALAAYGVAKARVRGRGDDTVASYSAEHCDPASDFPICSLELLSL